MAVKKSPPKRRSTSNHPAARDLSDGDVTFLSPDVLEFDLENPRLAQTAEELPDEEAIIRFLWKEMNVEELALSIAAWGYFKHEPLFAIKSRNRYIVIEGNRRLAAVKVLRSPQLQRTLNIEQPQLEDDVVKDTDELPVVVTTRKAVWQYIGFKHVNGPKPWDALAKAKYIARVRDEFGFDLDEIPKLIGDTHATVKRLYRGLMVLNQAQDQKLYDLEDRSNKRLFFSHLYTGLSYPGFQEFLGLKEEDGHEPNPIKPKYKKNLGHLCVWLFGSKEQRQPPLIKSQNPDLRHLDEALQSERGRDALTAGLPLDLAFDASIGDDRRFRESLIQAKVQLEQAWGKVHTGFDIKSDQLQTARAIQNMAGSLVDTMEQMTTSPKRRKA